MKSKILKYNWKWKLNKSPQEIWKVVGDVCKILELIDLPCNKPTNRPNKIMMMLFGSPDCSDTVHRCDWIRYTWIKTSSNAPFAMIPKIQTEWLIEPTKEGATLQVKITLFSNNFAALLAARFLIGHNGYKTLQKLAEKLNRSDSKVKNFLKNRPKNLTLKFEETKEAFLEEGFKAPWVEALYEMIADTPQAQAASLKPYMLADQHIYPRPAILSLFFAATDKGLLQHEWLANCPHCERWSHRISTLEDLTVKLLCGRCDQYFELELNKNIELVFRPHPSLRKVDPSKTNSLNPLWNPQVLVCQNLKPSAVMVLGTQLLPGSYVVHSDDADPDTWARFKVKESGAGETICEVTETGFDVIYKPHRKESRLTLTNRTDIDQQFIFEENICRELRCSAVDAFCCQRSRAILAHDSPPKNDPFSFGKVYLFASHIASASNICSVLGDRDAFFHFCKIREFQRTLIDQSGGAIISTHGNRIIACFTDKSSVIRLALTIQAEIGFMDSLSQNTVSTDLKLAVHSGDCLAINMANRFDLFGTTVCTIEGMIDQCASNELLLTESFAEDPTITAILNEVKAESETIKSILAGSDQPLTLVKVTGSQIHGEKLESENFTYSDTKDPNENTEDDFLTGIRFDEEDDIKPSDSGSGQIYV